MQLIGIFEYQEIIHLDGSIENEFIEYVHSNEGKIFMSKQQTKLLGNIVSSLTVYSMYIIILSIPRGECVIKPA